MRSALREEIKGIETPSFFFKKMCLFIIFGCAGCSLLEGFSLAAAVGDYCVVAVLGLPTAVASFVGEPCRA